MIKKKKKLSILYDDVPKLTNDEEIKENKKEKEFTKRNIKEIKKKNTTQEKESFNQINSLVK